MHVAESDWKAWRKIQPLALERLCRRVLHDIAAISSDEARSCHQRYLAVYQLIEERDQLIGDIFNDMSRSQAFFKIALAHKHQLITTDEFATFSDAFQQELNQLLHRNA